MGYENRNRAFRTTPSWTRCNYVVCRRNNVNPGTMVAKGLWCKNEAPLVLLPLTDDLDQSKLVAEVYRHVGDSHYFSRIP